MAVLCRKILSTAGFSPMQLIVGSGLGEFEAICSLWQAGQFLADLRQKLQGLSPHACCRFRVHRVGCSGGSE